MTCAEWAAGTITLPITVAITVTVDAGVGFLVGVVTFMLLVRLAEAHRTRRAEAAAVERVTAAALHHERPMVENVIAP